MAKKHSSTAIPLDVDTVQDNWRGRTDAYGSSDTDDIICWVCLEGPVSGKSLMQPCTCPRYCHPECIARWQLQSAGSRRETHCDFCQNKLPDWKNVLSPPGANKGPAIMNVNFDGRTYSFEVKPGPDGYRQFTLAIRRAFSLPEDSELNITFTCDEPCTGRQGDMLTLQGAGAYDAAVHCAALSAARRVPNSRNSSSNGSGELDEVEPRTLCPSFRNGRIATLGKRVKSTICDWLTFKRAGWQ